MKRRLLFIFLLLSTLSIKLNAQEVEPNDNIGDGGVKYITSNGPVSGNFSVLDADIFKIAPGASGTITVSYVQSPNILPVNLYEIGNPSVLASAINGNSFNYILDKSKSYYLQNSALLVGGAWQYNISGLLNDGQALDFDGINDRVIVPGGANLNNKSFTVEFWAKRAINNSNDYVFGQGTGIGTSEALHIGFRNNNDFTFAFYSNDINVTTTAATDGNFHHWACVYKSGTSGGVNRLIYLDGVLLASDRSPSDLIVPAPLDFVIGEAGYYGSWPGNEFGGLIDELRVWTEARTQCQIQDYMNCEIATSAPNLVANYHFNQGINVATNTGTNTLTDASGNNRTGNLNNFALSGETSNWRRPGGVTSNFTANDTPLAEMDVRGNAISIPNNDITPIAADYTDFATVLARTFTIFNTGTDILNVRTPYITGANASSFSVTSFPATTVAIGGSMSFVVKFTPSVIGTETAVINILNNDCDEPVYNFVVKGVTARGGLSFDGTNDFVTCGTIPSPSYVGTAITMEAWIRRKAGTGGSIMSMANFGVSSAWQLSVTPTGSVVGYLNSGSVTSTLSTVLADEWTHVAMLYNGSVLLLYINGNVVGSASLGSLIGTTAPLMIGASLVNGVASQFFSGDIDNVAMWSTVRGIAANMNLELVGNEIGLVTSYNFNYGTPEQSNLGYTLCPGRPVTYPGTLTNFALTGCPGNWVCGAPALGACSTEREISVKGNAINIPNGNTVTTTTDYSSFDNVVMGSALTRTFVVSNSGSANLTIGGVSLSGAGAFTITTGLPSSIASGASAPLVVAFSPTAAGLRTATLIIGSDDCDESSFAFNIDGIGVPPGAALDFGGSGDFVSISDVPLINIGASTDFTRECWIKYTGSAPNFAGLITKGNSGLGNWHQMVLYNNKFVIELFNNSTGISLSTNTFLNDGNWHHLAMTVKRSTNTVMLYVDGIMEAMTTNTIVSTNLDSADPLRLGVDRAGGTQFSGVMDEVRLWNTVRTQCEIQANMRCELSSGTGLVASYHFNQGVASVANSTANVLNDATGNNHTGTLNSFALTGSTSNWISPGGVVTGSITPNPPTATLSVSGNGNPINHGSTSTSTNNFTDFGSATTRTLVLKATGAGNLYLNTGIITGANASSFSITTVPGTVITSGGSNTVVIAFTPAALGTQTAALNIYSSDCAAPIYSFVIQGTAIDAAALNFDGNDDYVNVFASLVELGQSDFTIETWIKTTANDVGIISCDNGDANWESGEKQLYLENDGMPHFVGYGCGFIDGNIAVNDGNWHHIAVVWDLQTSPNGIGKMYIDGVDRTQASSYIAATANLGTFKFGRPNNNECLNYFSGEIDEVRFWNIARTQCEVQSFMNCELLNPGTITGMVGNYRMNSGIAGGSNPSISLATTAAGSNHASLINFAINGPTSNWVAPGAVTTGSYTAITPSISILVSGNGNTIAAGSVATSTTNYTDFDSSTLRTFSITNTGTTSINISSVTISGAHAADFIITGFSSSVIATGASGTMTFSFMPSATGTRTASISVSSNACTPAYSFVVSGTGTPGAALNFDGVDDYITRPTVSTATNNITLQAKVFLTGTSPSNQIIVYNGHTSLNGYGIIIAPNSTQVQVLLGSTTLIATGYTMALNQWTSLSLVIGSNRNKLYANGALVSNTGALPVVPSGSFMIGGNGLGGENFKGSIDEVMFWNTARTQCGIQAYQDCEIPVNLSSQLLANYHFNQGVIAGTNATVTSLTDASGNGNHATLTNLALTGTSSNWVSPGGVVTGFYTAATPSISMLVSGNSNTIAAGSVVTGTANYTDFGSATSRTFSITNTGTIAIDISSISISGANAANFSLTALSSSVIAVGTSANATFSFIPTGAGTRSANITFSSNDCSNPAYSFVVTASPLPGSALSFDGVNDLVNCSNILPTSSYTKEGWFMLQGGEAHLISSSTANGAYLWVVSDSGLKLSAGHNSNSILVQDPDALAINTWYHVAVSYDAATTTMRLYKNGILVSSNTSVPPASTYGVRLGQQHGSTITLNGSLDEVRIWNYPRNQCDIQTYMSAEITSTASGLIANYHFNQGIAFGTNTGTITVIDATGTNNGNMNGFALTGSTGNWVSPGAVANGFTTTATPSVEIDVTGNGNPVADNATATFTSNGTLFNSGTQTFVILNTGTDVLYINSTTLSGANAASFSLVTLPASSVVAGGSTSLVVGFSPTTAGTKNATVNITSNDCDEALYDFAINATQNSNALSFDGINDYIDLGNQATTQFGGVLPYTIQAWVKRRAGGSGVIAGMLNGGVTASWRLNVDAAGAVHSYRNVGPWEAVTASGLVQEDTWTHIATTYNGSTLMIYINGTLVSSQNIGTQPGTSAPLLIGATLNSGAPNEFFAGEIDELSIWNAARSQLQVAQTMTTVLVGNESNLVRYFNFNKGLPNGTNTAYTTLLSLPAGMNGTLNNFALTGCTSNYVCGVPAVGGCANPGELFVSGNLATILKGAGTATTSNLTDFGAVLAGTAVTHTFIVENRGDDPLSIFSFSLSGADAASYTITQATPGTFAGGFSMPLVVTFTPATPGTKQATLTITSNDCDESSFSFALSGTCSALASALDFDGSNDVVNCGPILPADYTKEAWIKLSSGAAQYNIISGGTTPLGHALFAPSSYGNRLSSGHNGIWNSVQDPTPLAFNTWYHVAVTYHSATNTMKLYKNGLLVSSNTNVFPSADNSVNIGWYDVASYFKGTIDEVRLWNTVRSQCEIQTYMSAEITSTASGLIANYHFNQGIPSGSNTSVTSLMDASGVNTGTLSGFLLTGSTGNWVSPGAIANSYTTPSAPTVSLNVTGSNNGSIPAGSAIPATYNETDFAGNTSRTFSLIANGGGPVYVNSVTLAGGNASSFSVTTVPPSSFVSQSGFVITYSPTTIGTHTAIVIINSSDCAAPDYSFAISASVAPASALAFDGLDDFVQAPNTTSLQMTNALSVEAWIKPVDNTNVYYIVSKGPSDVAGGQYGLVVITGTPYFHIYNSGHISLSATNSITPGVWSHIAGTWDGQTMRVYINGQLENSLPLSGTLPVNTGDLQFGRLGVGAYQYNGAMDEVRIWNTNRSQCELLTTMNAEIPGTAPGLVANYHFNQGVPSGPNATVTTLSDAVAGNNGTLTNFSLTAGNSTSNWISPGGVANDYTLTSMPVATLMVTGNGSTITAGSIATSTTNFTDFGGVTTRTFVAKNAASATSTLYINTVTFSGANASDFSVTTLPATSLTASGNSNFVITFTPAALGTRSAVVNVSSSDCTSPNYSFVITASTPTASALNFDGIDDHIDIPNSAGLTFTNAITLEAWIKTSDGSVPRTITAKHEDSWYLSVNGDNVSPGKATFYLNDVMPSGWMRSSTTVSDGNWHHIAGTYDGTIMKLYVDGVLEAQDVRSGTIATGPADAEIGTRGGLDLFEGTLDEVRLWSIARSECDIKAYMNCEIPTTAPGLAANYHFNQGIPSGPNSTVTTLSDATGVNNGALSSFTLSGNTSNWVSPGGVISGSIVPGTALSASLVISGNGNTIVNGSIATSTNNFTDFGLNTTHTFTVTNSSATPLYFFTGKFTGANASEFTVTVPPTATLGSGGTSSFQVVFTPTSVGSHSATLNVYSSDCNAPVYSFVVTASTTPASALALDGSNHVQMMDPNFGLSDFTIEAWVKPNGFGSHSYVLSTRTGEGGGCCNYWDFGYNLAGEPFFEMGENNSGIIPGINLYNSTPIPDGAWSHIAAVRSNTLVSLYVNGLLVGTANSNVVLNSTTGNNSLRIGGSGAGLAMFNGSVDEVRLWNIARSQCQIQTYMSAEITSTASGLLSNYHFNQGIPSGANATVTTLTDAAGSNNGLLNDFNLTTGNSTSNWVSPGGVPNGSVTPNVPTATLAVEGNGNTIAYGSTATGTTNFTDFGNVTSRAFVVKNSSALGTLGVNDVLLTGAHSADFSVTTLPPASLAGNMSGSFVVTFVPQALGTRSAIVNVISSDCSHPTYSFVITATSTPANALSFDGNSNFITAPAVNLNGQSFTVEFWAKKNALTGTSYLVGQNAGATLNNILHVGFRQDDTFTFAFYGNDLNYTVTPTIDNNWHHWAAVYNANTAGTDRFIYMDGNLVASDDALGDYIGSGPLMLGMANGGYFYNGTMDEVRIWNTARSQCEIQSYMRCEITSTASALLANYHFNQGIPSGFNTTETTLTDATGNFDGTLSGFDLTQGNNTSNWVSPGGVMAGSVTPNVPTATLAVEGNGNNIAYGSTITGTTNFTDFGAAATRTFVAKNAANSGTLYINLVTLSGANAADFSVTTLPSASLTNLGTSNFVIAFNPTSVGTRSAVVNINSSDCTHPTYSFVITGSVSAASALAFDGINNNIININYIQPTTNITNEFWFNTTNGDQGMFEVNDGFVAGWDRNISLVSGNVSAYIWLGGPSEIITSTGTNYADGNWHHVAHVISASEGQKLYVDGILKASGTSTASDFNFNTTVVLGFASIANPNYYFTGKMDEVRLWNVARTQCEIQTYMHAEITSTASGLVANYHFNQGIPSGLNTTETTLTDATGSFDGTLTNFDLTQGNSTSNWVSPGGVISGSVTPNVPTATLAVEGNGNTISYGNNTPNTSNFTDFGAAPTRTFVAKNAAGSGTLYVGNITLSGADASDFSITAMPSASLSGLAASDFVIAFNPTAVGSRSAIVNISSSDCTHPTYSFVITGSVSAASALAFDGLDDYMDVFASHLPSGNSDHTIEFWTKIKSVQTGHRWIAAWGLSDVSNQMVSIGYDASDGNKIRIHHFGPDLIANTASIPTGVWTHVAITYNGSANTNDIYINGNFVESLTFGTPLNIPSAPDLQIGTYTSLNTYATDIELDELRAWSTARTPCEIQSYMPAEIPTTAPGLVANFHFNQGIPSGNNFPEQIAIDASNNVNGKIKMFDLNAGNSLSNWISPSIVPNSFTTVVAPSASITLSANSNSIINNAPATSTLNFTDFDGVSTRTFVITNTGSTPLTVATPVLTGADAAQFAITTAPATTIAPNGNTSFVVAFTPTSGGIKTATVHISNNDCSKPVFIFPIEAPTPVASALDFDGIDDYVDAPYNSALDLTSALSLEAWVKPADNSGVYYVVSKGTDDGAPGQYGLVVINGTPQFHFYNTSPAVAVDATQSIPPGVWTHLAGTWDGTTMNLYINGALNASTNFSGPLSTNTDVLRIGQLGIVDYSFKGSIDEVRVWNHARSQCDILTYMNAEATATLSGLVANYHFNHGSAGLDNTGITTLSDDSPTANDGALSGNFTLNGATSNWVTPGGVANGSNTVTVPPGNIQLYGNNIFIPNSSASTGTNNFTDFGSVSTRTFSVKNLGSGGFIYLNNITISGPHAPDFNVTSMPAPTLAASGSGSTEFEVTFNASAVGTRSAVVHVSSSDCSIPDYSFAVTGSVVPAAALNFDGDDRVDCGNILTASYTKEAWINISNLTYANNFISGGPGATGHAFWAPAVYSNQLSAGHSGSWTAVQDPTPLSANTWYHIAVTYDAPSTTMMLYKNGALVSINTNVAPYTGNNVFIADFTGTDAFVGTMDEVRIWDNARSQCDIQTYMSCEIPGSTTGLLANYHFNQGVPSGSNPGVTTLTDATGVNTGTLINFSLQAGNISNWVSPGAVNPGYTVITTPSAEINILGNAVTINNDDVTPSAADNTDFGGTCINTGVTKTYTVQNTGSTPLTVSSVTVTGADANMFSFATVPPATVAASGSMTFAVTFSPSVEATANASVLIYSSDCDEYLYNFAITGTVSPSPTISTTNAQICAGQSYTLSATGADTYTYSTGPVVNPLTTTDYSVTGTSTAGCVSSNTAVATVSVNAIPTLSISASSASICSGTAATLTANGASTYLWSNSLTTQSISVSPTADATYTVTGTDANGCVGTMAHTVYVNALPVITASNTSICPDNSHTFFPTGAVTYTYSSGQVVFPTTTTSYSITGTDANGCVSATPAVVTVSVINTVTVLITGPTTICEGITTTLTASGATSYSWTNGALTSSAALSPMSNTSYTVYGVTGTCTNNAVVNVSVNAAPVLTVNSGAICSGQSFTIMPSGAVSYVYSGGSAIVSPVSTTPYTVTGTDANGCTNLVTAVSIVTVNALPTVAINTSTTDICEGAAVTLTASGASTYTWSNALTTTVISVSPVSNTSYNVSGTDANGCINTAVQGITVNPLPTISVNSGAICPGNSFTFTPSGAATYTYSSGQVIFPSASANYTITGSSALGCTAAAAAIATVDVVNTLTVTITGNTVICEGLSTTLTANAASTYSWSNGTLTSSVVLSPTVTTTYTVYGASGTCSNTAVVTVSVNAAPSVSVTSGTICSGESFTMVPSGAVSYTYPGGSNSVNPVNTTTYSVGGTDALGCVSIIAAISTVSVNALPVLTVTTASGSICDGAATTVSVSGANTYLWSNALTTNTIAVSPSTTTPYSVEGTDGNGCVGTATQVITVNPLPTITIPNGAICPGNSYTLVPSGAATYTFSSGTDVVSPPALGTYTYAVLGTSSMGCVASASAIATLSVINTLSIAVTGSTSVCEGQSATLTASGASTYSWSNGITTDSVTLLPTSNTTYTVYGASGTCSNSAVVTITVNSAPGVNVNSGVICSGQSFTMNPSGTVSYSYSGGSDIVSPTTTTSYSVTGIDALGCASTTMAISTVTVNALPTPTITATGYTLCSGVTTTLTVSGITTYTWSDNSNANNIAVAPASNTTYSVSGTGTNGCVGSTLQAIAVNPLPTITVPGGVICPGNSFTLAPSGAATYSFSSGTDVVTPPAIGTYTYGISGTSSLGCVASTSAIATVSVINSLTIPVTGNTVICVGQTATLTAGGATTYSWSNGVTTDTVTLSPTANTTYTVYGVSGTCSNNAVVQVSVNAVPTITVNSGAICSGSSFTLNPGGAVTYTYSNGSAIVNPIANASYSVAGTNAAGCVSTASAIANVTVNASPTVAIASPTAVCDGSPVTLTVSGATSYSWNTTSTAAVITPTPAPGSNNYSVTGTDANGCSSTASQSIHIDPLPTITVNGGAVCPGGSFTLNPQGAATYSFSSGSDVVSPPVIGTYTYGISGASAAGCVASGSAIATVSVVSTLTLTVSGNTTICTGEQSSLTVGGASSYSWSTGITTDTITLSPNATTDYTVYGMSGSCMDKALVTVSVNALPTVSVSGGTICSGSGFTFVPSGALTYSYSGGSAVVNPTINTSYSVTGVDANGCVSSNTAIAEVTVMALPTVTVAITNPSVCAGNTTSLSAGGATAYVWSDAQTAPTIAITPGATTVYTVTGTDANGCQNSASVTAFVSPGASLTVSGSSLVCAGTTASLSVSGASTYTWNTGETTSTLGVTPGVTTSYSVTGSLPGSCDASVVSTISVSPMPTLTVSGADSVCVNSTVVLGASGANTYSWSTGETSPSITFIPSLSGTYSVTGTNSVGCSATSTVDVVIKSCVKKPIELVNAVTPNSDGLNDTWIIRNIQEYPKNKVVVFNRWGIEVYSVTGYNNDDKVWPAKGETTNLTASTYFYIIDLKDGSKPIKGWVELIKD